MVIRIKVIVHEFVFMPKQRYTLSNTRKHPLCRYILGVLKHTTDWDGHWGVNEILIFLVSPQSAIVDGASQCCEALRCGFTKLGMKLCFALI